MWHRSQVAETALTAEAYDTAAVQNRGRRCSRCCCASRGRCRDRPTAAAEPGVLDVVPLSVATGNVRVYITALSYSRRLVVTLKQ